MVVSYWWRDAARMVVSGGSGFVVSERLWDRYVRQWMQARASVGAVSVPIRGGDVGDGGDRGIVDVRGDWLFGAEGYGYLGGVGVVLFGGAGVVQVRGGSDAGLSVSLGDAVWSMGAGGGDGGSAVDGHVVAVEVVSAEGVSAGSDVSEDVSESDGLVCRGGIGLYIQVGFSGSEYWDSWLMHVFRGMGVAVEVLQEDSEDWRVPVPVEEVLERYRSAGLSVVYMVYTGEYQQPHRIERCFRDLLGWCYRHGVCAGLVCTRYYHPAPHLRGRWWAQIAQQYGDLGNWARRAFDAATTDDQGLGYLPHLRVDRYGIYGRPDLDLHTEQGALSRIRSSRRGDGGSGERVSMSGYGYGVCLLVPPSGERGRMEKGQQGVEQESERRGRRGRRSGTAGAGDDGVRDG